MGTRRALLPASASTTSCVSGGGAGGGAGGGGGGKGVRLQLLVGWYPLVVEFGCR